MPLAQQLSLSLFVQLTSRSVQRAREATCRLCTRHIISINSRTSRACILLLLHMPCESRVMDSCNRNTKILRSTVLGVQNTKYGYLFFFSLFLLSNAGQISQTFRGRPEHLFATNPPQMYRGQGKAKYTTPDSLFCIFFRTLSCPLAEQRPTPRGLVGCIVRGSPEEKRGAAALVTARGEKKSERS